MKKLLALSLSVVLLGAGCSATPTARPSTTGPTPSIAVGEPNPSAPKPDKGCANAYFPNTVGHEVTYAMPMAGKTYKYSSKVVAVGKNSLSLETRMDNDITVKQDFTCEGSGVKANGYLDLGSAISGTKFEFKTVSQDGIYLPQTIKLGEEWASNISVEGKVLSGPLLTAGINQLNEKVSVKSKALANERVTVGAGTFDAIKVQQDTTISVDYGTSTRIPALKDIKSTSFVWLAEGVGMVKTQTAISGTTSTIEAVSIQK